MMYTKKNVKYHEYAMHRFVYGINIVNVPAIYNYDRVSGVLEMQKIPNMSIADYYGEEFSTVPVHIITKIREIIKILYNNDIEYPDITGYNFIEWGDDIWIIDFEHATPLEDECNDPFVLDFINGREGWNPRFA